MNPLISVIIPAHNNGSSLGTAVQSIIAQTYTNLEIIIVDDFSTDDTLALAQRWAASDHRIRVVSAAFDDPKRFDAKLSRNINAGYSARNTGINTARGTYITFQDADDVSFLNRIELQLKLARDHGATHVCTQAMYLDPKLVGKKIDVETALKEAAGSIITSAQIRTLAQKNRGVLTYLPSPLWAAIPFRLKRARVINKLFFRRLDPYPSGGCPFVTRELAQKIMFSDLPHRIWPSFMGRGADRDFNFKCGVYGKKSIAVTVPLYMWSRLQPTAALHMFERYLY